MRACIQEPQTGARDDGSEWSLGAAPSRRYDNLAAPFPPIFRRVQEGATQRERNRVLPFEQIEWLKDAGFGAVRAPKEYGGRGATLPELFALLAELAEADSNLTQALRVHFAYLEDVLNSQDPARRERWFKHFVHGDIVGGAWTEIGEAKMASFSTRVSEKNGRLTLTGAKYYTTGSLFADWIDVGAVNDAEETVSAVVPAKAPGVEIVDDWDGFGQKLTASGGPPSLTFLSSRSMSRAATNASATRRPLFNRFITRPSSESRVRRPATRRGPSPSAVETIRTLPLLVRAPTRRFCRSWAESIV
jgi:hypothetical protein